MVCSLPEVEVEWEAGGAAGDGGGGFPALPVVVVAPLSLALEMLQRKFCANRSMLMNIWKELDNEANEQREGMFLRVVALLFTCSSHNLTVEEDDELRRMRWIYLVAGECHWYGSTPREYFTDDFQNMSTHSTLSKEEEPKPFRDHHNMLAGLDFVVALESDVFAYTYEGNMVKAVQGHWRFEDFKTTISRNSTSGILLFKVINYVYLAYMVLAFAFAPLEYYSHLWDYGFSNHVLVIQLMQMNFVDHLEKIPWKKFSSEVKKLHKDRRGAPYLTDVGRIPKLGESFYANALPGGICELKE
ncbi:hypothetical protein Vadar_019935 [Vaccinium darrowii]|uniref:Uncharacterized protein n=1 Tax=Vaccinium darrowii TaxID=229202 RepID=A0ACB7Z6I7_9ERIC|nr:hypothetical protein Vadar_019935 [Vaccinium darrowii]